MPALKDPLRLQNLRRNSRHMSDRSLRQQAQYNLILSYVASAHHIRPEFLLAASRGSKHLSEARQTTNYLAHIVYGMNFTDIGHLAARDRTSIAHGCGRVEDLRDEPARDRILHFAELALHLAFANSWEIANDD